MDSHQQVFNCKPLRTFHFIALITFDDFSFFSSAGEKSYCCTGYKQGGGDLLPHHLDHLRDRHHLHLRDPLHDDDFNERSNSILRL